MSGIHDAIISSAPGGVMFSGIIYHNNAIAIVLDPAFAVEAVAKQCQTASHKYFGHE
jgi:hypothetical protein